MAVERFLKWLRPSKRGRRGEEETSEGAWCCKVIPIERAFTMTYKSHATPAAECVRVIP